MRRFAAALCAFILIAAFPFTVVLAEEEPAAQDQTESIRQEVHSQINALDLSGWERVLSGTSKDALGLVGEQSLDDVISAFAEGDTVVDPLAVINTVFKLLLGEAGKQIGLMISLVALALVSSLLTNLKSSFSGEGVGEIAHYVIYLLLSAILVNVLWQCVGVARGAVDAMVNLMQALFPILITVLTAMGNAASAGVFQPTMAMLTGAVASFIRDVIMPAVLMGGLISVVSRMSEHFPIKRLGGVLNSGVKWATGIVFTLFLGIMGLQGLNASAVDGLTIKTAKFTIDKMIPMVGGYMSDTMDTLLGCSLIVKNAAGATGLISIVVVMLTPLVRLLALAMILKLTAALVEPVSDRRLSDCIDCVSSSVAMLFAVVLSVGAMFFISVSLILGAGNVSIMMR